MLTHAVVSRACAHDMLVCFPTLRHLFVVVFAVRQWPDSGSMRAASRAPGAQFAWRECPIPEGPGTLATVCWDRRQAYFSLMMSNSSVHRPCAAACYTYNVLHAVCLRQFNGRL